MVARPAGLDITPTDTGAGIATPASRGGQASRGTRAGRGARSHTVVGVSGAATRPSTYLRRAISLP